MPILYDFILWRDIEKKHLNISILITGVQHLYVMLGANLVYVFIRRSSSDGLTSHCSIILSKSPISGGFDVCYNQGF